MDPIEYATLSTKVPPRVFALNAIQIVGILAASLAIPSPETAAILAMLPAEISGNVGKLALAFLAAKPAVNMFGDFIDNGKIDKSFPGVGFWVMLAACLFLTGCGSGLRILPPTADGCFLIERATQPGESRKYAFGPCIGQDGKVDRYRGLWLNLDGVTFESTYTIATKRLVVTYQAPGQPALEWDSKTGIALDLPPGVSLDGKGAGAQVAAP